MTLYLILSLILIKEVSTIGIPLHNGPRCMLIQGQFDPIKLQIKFPAIPNKKEDQKFMVTLSDYLSQQVIFDVLLEEKIIYRKNLDLSTNVFYHLCIQIWSTRDQFDPKTEQMWAQYTADEDFDALIGTFEVPEQLRGEANLKYIYQKSQSINHLNRRIVDNQEREREIQQSIATSNLQKNQKINTLTIIECLVIVLSGVYQVLALRRFLIDKQLY